MSSLVSAVKATLPGQLGTDAYEKILNGITTFELPVNALLTESKLAKEMGVSRTPVREALHRLEKEGLVRKGPSGRFTVALLTPREVDEACDVISLMDSYLFCRGAERITSEQAAVLVGCAEEMLSAAVRGDVQAWTASDARFHEIGAKTAQNDAAAEIARMTRRRIQRFSIRAISVYSDRFTACSSEHVAIARAVAERRVADIPILVNEHVNHMRHSVLDSLTAIATFLGSES